MKQCTLAPIRDTARDWDAVADAITKLFAREIYGPLIAELRPVDGASLVLNAENPLVDALRAGRVVFYRGQFSGRFSAAVSRELRAIGAKWDRRHGTFKISTSALPAAVRRAVQLSESQFERTLDAIDKRLAEILPESIADKLSLTAHYDKMAHRFERDFQSSIRGITIAPKFTPEQQAKLAARYNDNMKLEIQNWTKREITRLRAQVSKNVMRGLRYEDLTKKIQSSYGVSRNKAKFLARQETNLLTCEIRKMRYQDAGSKGYIWKCVAGSPSSPVRPMHKKLDGKFVAWDDPPIVNDKGDRKHAGEDFGCRCYPRAVVRF